MFYCLPSQSNHTESYPEYDNKWEDQMRQAFQIAKNHSEARKENDITRKVIEYIKARKESISKKPV